MDYLSVFRSKYGEDQVLEAYDAIMDLSPVSYYEMRVRLPGWQITGYLK